MGFLRQSTNVALERERARAAEAEYQLAAARDEISDLRDRVKRARADETNAVGASAFYRELYHQAAEDRDALVAAQGEIKRLNDVIALRNKLDVLAGRRNAAVSGYGADSSEARHAAKMIDAAVRSGAVWSLTVESRSPR